MVITGRPWTKVNNSNNISLDAGIMGNLVIDMRSSRNKIARQKGEMSELLDRCNGYYISEYGNQYEKASSVTEQRIVELGEKIQALSDVVLYHSNEQIQINNRASMSVGGIG